MIALLAKKQKKMFWSILQLTCFESCFKRSHYLFWWSYQICNGYLSESAL